MHDPYASLGPVCAVIGAQWGDEGKGKIIDILAEDFDVIARACGGANAGHTIVVGGNKHVFHLLPAGSLHEGKPVVLGAGMVIHLPTLLEEIATLKDSGIDIVHRLHLSPAAHIVFEYHKEIDAVMEDRRASAKGQGIGTTKRGIGPAYMDKAARSGLRIESLRWSEKDLERELAERAVMVKEMYGVTVQIERELTHLRSAKKLLESRIAENTVSLMADFLRKKKKILIEGAQASLLDLDHGTYPYVTSSFTTAAGALQGLGLPPKTLTSVIGVAKAYCTRVGSGTFLTEVTGATGDRLRERGGEYGATTGRPRRCGWMYIPDLKFAAELSGFDCWNITKLDVLDEEDVIPIGIGEKNGKAIYQELPGWKTSTSGITSFADLPKNAQEFIRFVERQTGIKASFIGTGQERQAMIMQ